MTQTPITIPQDIIDRINTVAEGRERVLVALVGAPGAGKSTLAEAVQAQLPGSAILPMDGFHLDNETLRARGLFERKGAPQTFDTDGLIKLLDKVRAGGAVSVPTFDRSQDAVVPDGDSIPADAKIILVEGNYLLLDAPGWGELAPYWDLSIALDVPEAELERRLIQRWLDHGLDRAAAEARARGNDLINARLVIEASRPADVSLKQG